MSSTSSEHIGQFVRAGAGAGKTWNLTRQVVGRALDFREKNGQWPRTVLTTFTRKATQELKERLLTYCLKEQPEAIEYVQSSSFLNITTMHGLLSVFLSRYGSVVGLPNQLRIVDSAQTDFWRRQIIKDMVTNGEWPESLQKIELHRLMAYLKSYQEVHFNPKMQPLDDKQMTALFDDWLKTKAEAWHQCLQQVQSETDHEKWSLMTDRLQGVALSFTKPWAEARVEISEQLTGLRLPVKSKNNPGPSPETKVELKALIDDLKSKVTDEQFDPEQWSGKAKLLKDFSIAAREVESRLMQKKIEEASLEANDLEQFSLHLQHSHPQCAEKFAKDFDAWFIDEFQDTSPLQLKILEPMIGKTFSYLVGDPQQSIYSFRGSRSEVFYDKQTSMEKMGATMQDLSHNYRSQSQLLEFINDFFTSLGSQFSAMTAEIQSTDSQPCVHIGTAIKEEPEAELNQLVQNIADLLAQGKTPKDIGVLARTNKQLDLVQKRLMALGYPVISHSSANYYGRREVLDALAFLRFLLNPWDNTNLVLLLRSPWMSMPDREIQQVIGKNKGHFWLLFNSYFQSLPDKESGQALLQALQEKDELGVGFVFRRLLIELGMLNYCNRIDSTGRREANLWKLINLVEKTSREPGNSLLKLSKDGALASQLEDIGDDADASSPVEPNKISLMTIHASKGLQFPCVFLPFLHKKDRETPFLGFSVDDEKSLWSFRTPVGRDRDFKGGLFEELVVQKMRRREREESLRLLYVAITRAEQEVYISWTGEPTEKSWGTPLREFASRNESKDYLRVYEISESQPESYSGKEEEVSVRSPFQEIKHSLTERSEKSQPKDLQQILDTQKARRSGTVLHRVFESLKHHDPATILAGREGAGELKEALEFIWQNQEVPFQEIIKEGEVEWGYQYQEDGFTKEKRVDLWGIVDGVLWIVDYKTGSSRYKEKAFEQMQHYADSLKSYLSFDGEINTVAVYPFSKEILVRSY